MWESLNNGTVNFENTRSFNVSHTVEMREPYATKEARRGGNIVG